MKSTESHLTEQLPGHSAELIHKTTQKIWDWFYLNTRNIDCGLMRYYAGKFCFFSCIIYMPCFLWSYFADLKDELFERGCFVSEGRSISSNILLSCVKNFGVIINVLDTRDDMIDTVYVEEYYLLFL
jgi:hypothetical protein